MHVSETEIILRHNGIELAHVTLPPGTYIIGRSALVEISANTPLISRKHARLTLKDGDILLQDLASTNGTFVADRALTEAARVLRDQAIRMGPEVPEKAASVAQRATAAVTAGPGEPRATAPAPAPLPR